MFKIFKRQNREKIENDIIKELKIKLSNEQQKVFQLGFEKHDLSLKLNKKIKQNKRLQNQIKKLKEA